MVSKDKYIKDPCGTLSIPYYKASRVEVPPHISIIHNKDLTPNDLIGYSDDVYFRLYHSLKDIPKKPDIGDLDLLDATDDDTEDMVNIINASYPDIRVTRQQLESIKLMDVYRSELWIKITDNCGNCVACAIGELDSEFNELSIEWVQVLPQYRRKRLGKALVTELLRRGKAIGAEFATVAGRINSPSQPIYLYRACGFDGDDIWHVLTKSTGKY